jgi:drug/metabolite transporter (DMT)-like permease
MQNRFILILIGASSAALHLSMQFGFHFAPNPGYVNSINAASSAFVTLFSAFIFKEELKFRKVAAIFGIVIGLSFMFI